MRDAYQGPAIVAYLHSRKQHYLHRFQQSTTFHSNSSYRDTQAITKLPRKFERRWRKALGDRIPSILRCLGSMGKQAQRLLVLNLKTWPLSLLLGLETNNTFTALWEMSVTFCQITVLSYIASDWTTILCKVLGRLATLRNVMWFILI